MSKRTKLFKKRNIYGYEKSNELFFLAMKENCLYQYKHCPTYKKILDEKSFHPDMLNNYDDLKKIPFIPTLYFKHHQMWTLSKKRILIKATSSGTSGNMSHIGLNFMSAYRGLKMILKTGKYHKLFSLKPTHCFILGYEISKKNQMAHAKSAKGFTYFSPCLSRTYALKNTKNGYQLDLENLKKKLIKCGNSKFPTKIVGFPYYTYCLLKQMQSEGVKINLPKSSSITLGGGWKQFYAQKVDKVDFYNLANEVLGIKEENIHEFFSAVEHPILYKDCKYHHFHIPIYSRVIIRDVDTLEPIENGKIGLINFLTPMVDSVPLLSVMTDDLGILHNDKCECGIDSPYLEIIGRVGIKDIITCAAGAEEYLKK